MTKPISDDVPLQGDPGGITQKDVDAERVELQAQIDALEAKLRAAQELDDELSGRFDTWLITTPNPGYSGVVLGIRFENGYALIKADAKIERFEFPPISDAYMRKFEYTPEMIEAVRQREKTPSAQRCAMELKNDFGYQVRFFTKAEHDQLLDAIQEQMRRAGQALTSQVQLSEKLIPPYFMGESPTGGRVKFGG